MGNIKIAKLLFGLSLKKIVPREFFWHFSAYGASTIIRNYKMVIAQEFKVG